MRRKDREQNQTFALAVTDKCEYAVVSMTLSDGQPYCVPLTIVRDGDSLYFHCALEGQKVDALRANPRVCVACVGDTRPVEDKFSMEYESAILTGTAEEVIDETEKIHALRLLCLRHTPHNMADFDRAVAGSLARTGIWKIRCTSVTGKAKKYPVRQD